MTPSHLDFSLESILQLFLKEVADNDAITVNAANYLNGVVLFVRTIRLHHILSFPISISC